MMYLIGQTWLFLTIAWLIGVAVGFAYARDQKSQRHRQVEEELRDARNRSIEVDKEVDEYRQRVGELEGLPQGARASRVAARDEMLGRMGQLERELEASRASEKRVSDEAERLRSDVDGFRTRYLEARAKWDEYQAKAEALATAPAPLHLGEAQMVVEDNELRQRIMELEGMVADIGRARDRAADQARTLGARIGELEGQVAAAGRSERPSEQTKTLQARINELEKQLAAANKGDDRSAAQTNILQARIGELEAQLASAGRGGERGSDQAKTLQARISELEGRLAAGINAARENDALKSRVADLQDKLGEAEVALRKSIGATKQDAEPLRARISELETKLAAKAAGSADTKSGIETGALRVRLAEVEAKLGEAQRQAGEAQALRQRLVDAEKGARPPAANDEEVRRLKNRTADLEQALERARRQAADAQSLRAQVTSLEARLSDSERDLVSTTGEDVALLKARLADVETRLMASSSSSSEFEALRSRVMTLEALLHEAAKSRDEAAILRSKVAELDGRLGQAMKAAGRTRADEKV